MFNEDDKNYFDKAEQFISSNGLKRLIEDVYEDYNENQEVEIQEEEVYDRDEILKKFQGLAKAKEKYTRKNCDTDTLLDVYNESRLYFKITGDERYEVMQKHIMLELKKTKEQ